MVDQEHTSTYKQIFVHYYLLRYNTITTPTSPATCNWNPCVTSRKKWFSYSLTSLSLSLLADKKQKDGLTSDLLNVQFLVNMQLSCSSFSPFLTRLQEFFEFELGNVLWKTFLIQAKKTKLSRQASTPVLIQINPGTENVNRLFAILCRNHFWKTLQCKLKLRQNLKHRLIKYCLRQGPRSLLIMCLDVFMYHVLWLASVGRSLQNYQYLKSISPYFRCTIFGTLCTVVPEISAPSPPSPRVVNGDITKKWICKTMEFG